MRYTLRTLAGIVCVASLSGLVIAPLVRAEGPATAPAVDQGKILVLPFTALNKAESQAWLGRSIQQSLLADLTVVAPARATAADTEVNDASAAIDVGRRAAATYVVLGAFATVNQELRVTGQLLDVTTGKAVAGLKATGPATDVFRLEDQLAAQIRRALALGPPSLPSPAAQGPAVAQSEPAYGPLRVEGQLPADEYYQAYANPPAQNQYYYNTYYYQNPYSYPAYDWGGWYPWWGFGGVVFFDEDFGSHGRNSRDFDRDFDVRAWHGANRPLAGAPGVGVGTLHAGAGTLHAGVGTLHAGAGAFHAGAGTFHGGMGMAARGGFGGGRAGGAARGGGGHR